MPGIGRMTYPGADVMNDRISRAGHTAQRQPRSGRRPSTAGSATRRQAVPQPSLAHPRPAPRVPASDSALTAQQQRLAAATCADLACRGIEPQATWARDSHLAEPRTRIRLDQNSGP